VSFAVIYLIIFAGWYIMIFWAYCRRLAELRDVRLRVVYRAAEAALGQISPDP
jgi:hypothetical protein